ncbi:dephospho-CoA kinase [Brevibacterium yomogidense]|uniref:dephospho-CoA kinase n=1 Tax=Brevibacterium yomogidense TaxID=946573 RepID=UPI0018DF955F|nr:dephospho-CoA kinase [Brevibacterium yomogidense]
MGSSIGTQQANGPLVLGLTGGIGAGKSTVAALFRSRGAGVVDADAIAREVVEPGEPALAALAAEFGEGVLTEGGTLDRAALASLAFADPERTAALNAIMHPAIGDRTTVRLAELGDHDVVVHDVPLLVENGMTGRYHLSVLVDVPAHIRLARLTTTRGLDPDDAQRRIRAQADDDARYLACDVLLDNSTSPDELEARFAQLWKERIDPFRRNRANGVPASGASVGPAEMTDRAQEAAGARLLARIEHAAAEAGLHVSGTSSPGPSGVQIALAEPGPAAAADAPASRAPDSSAQLSQVLADVGFAPVRGAHGRYANTDPGRPAIVTMRDARTS